MNLLVRVVDRMPARVARRLRRETAATRMLRPLANAVLPNRPTTVVVRSGAAEGIRLRIDPRREKFYWTGVHEQHVQAALERLVAPGSVMWDVGAHIGFFALSAARRAGPDGTVVAFEPVPDNRARLEENIALNSASNVVVVDEALGAVAGEADIYRHGESLMWSLRGTGDGGHVTIRVSTLDDAARRLPTPDVVKVDAEGAELDVLRGGANLLAERRPTIVLELMRRSDLAVVRELLPWHDALAIGANHYVLSPGA